MELVNGKLGGGGDDYGDWVEAQKSEDHTRAAGSQNKKEMLKIVNYFRVNVDFLLSSGLNCLLDILVSKVRLQH